MDKSQEGNIQFYDQEVIFTDGTSMKVKSKVKDFSQGGRFKVEFGGCSSFSNFTTLGNQTEEPYDARD